MSGDIKEAFLDTIRETVEGKKPGMIKSGWRRATWLADAWFSVPKLFRTFLALWLSLLSPVNYRKHRL